MELAPQPFALREKARSAANAIVAPRLFNYQRPGSGWTEGLVDTPEQAVHAFSLLQTYRHNQAQLMQAPPARAQPTIDIGRVRQLIDAVLAGE